MDNKDVSNEENNKMKYILYYLITASVVSLGGIIYKFSKENKDRLNKFLNKLSKKEINELSPNAKLLYEAGYNKPNYFKLSEDNEPTYQPVLGGNKKKSKKKINKNIMKSKKNIR